MLNLNEHKQCQVQQHKKWKRYRRQLIVPARQRDFSGTNIGPQSCPILHVHLPAQSCYVQARLYSCFWTRLWKLFKLSQFFPPSAFLNVPLNCNLLNNKCLKWNFFFLANTSGNQARHVKVRAKANQSSSGQRYGFIATFLRQNRLQMIACPSSYQIHFSELKKNTKKTAETWGMNARTL